MNNMLYCSLLFLMSVCLTLSHFLCQITSPCFVLPHSLQLHSERSDSDVLHFVLLISELCPLCSCPVRTVSIVQLSSQNCVHCAVVQSKLCPLCSCPVRTVSIVQLSSQNRTLHANCVFWDVKQC